MKIRKLKLFTNKLELEKIFYSQTLGFKIIESNSNYFTLKIGWSELTFEKTAKEYKYHYCFLIPSNQLDQAMEWMEKRIPIVDIENGRKKQRVESWNADSFYFYDASGNIAEFIVRQELDNGILSDFNISDVLCVNEIGMPTNNVEKTNNELLQNFGTEFWKGDLKRFGTNGSPEGLFLLPNFEIKEIWFPTSSMKVNPEPFEILFENNGEIYNMKYINGEITTTANN
jgi:hypothetical protein